MLSLTDPLHNMVFEAHQYFDRDSSGTDADCVSPAETVARTAVFTNWLRAYGRKGFIGEFGGGPRADCDAALDAFADHVAANADVYVGWALWGARAVVAGGLCAEGGYGTGTAVGAVGGFVYSVSSRPESRDPGDVCADAEMEPRIKSGVTWSGWVYGLNCSYGSCQSGLPDSISSSFQRRRQRFSCFSRAMAAVTSSNIS